MIPVYIRLVDQFAPDDEFSLGALTLRRYSAEEALELREALRTRDVFARHANDGDFYTRRALAFSDKPVLLAKLTYDYPDPSSIRREADIAEALLIIASAFNLKRPQLHSHIVGRANRSSTIDLHIDVRTGKLSSLSRDATVQRPLTISPRCARRYSKLGFDGVVQRLAATSCFLGRRLRTACRWLHESRLDPNVGAAFIKTGTAAETLIAGNSMGQVTKR